MLKSFHKILCVILKLTHRVDAKLERFVGGLEREKPFSDCR